MKDLSELYISLGLNDSETYIQSGNVISRCNAEMPVSSLSEKIEAAILERFNYTIPVMIRTVQDMKDLFISNPFLPEENFEPSKMAVIFLHEAPSDDQIQKVADINYPPDKFKIIGREIYIYCPNGFGRTKLYTNFFEKKISVAGTARNWETITTKLNIAEKKI